MLCVAIAKKNPTHYFSQASSITLKIGTVQEAYTAHSEDPESTVGSAFLK